MNPVVLQQEIAGNPSVKISFLIVLSHVRCCKFVSEK